MHKREPPEVEVDKKADDGEDLERCFGLSHETRLYDDASGSCEGPQTGNSEFPAYDKRNDPRRSASQAHKHDECRRHDYLVGNGVYKLAELAHLPRSSRYVSVKEVGDGSQGKYHGRRDTKGPAGKGGER